MYLPWLLSFPFDIVLRKNIWSLNVLSYLIIERPLILIWHEDDNIGLFLLLPSIVTILLSERETVRLSYTCRWKSFTNVITHHRLPKVWWIIRWLSWIILFVFVKLLSDHFRQKCTTPMPRVIPVDIFLHLPLSLPCLDSYIRGVTLKQDHKILICIM